MSIAPIVKTVSVAIPPARAFEAFARNMGRWWAAGKTIGAEPHVDIVIEPREGGRWYEVDAKGAETDWGKVLAWEPPGRLLLAWQLDASFRYDPNFETELELSFVPEGSGTRVTLEHRNMERFGPSAAKVAEQLGGGWPGIVDRFVQFCEEKETTE